MTCIVIPNLNFWQRRRLFNIKAVFKSWVSHQNNKRFEEGNPPLIYQQKLIYLRKEHQSINNGLVWDREKINVTFDEFVELMFRENDTLEPPRRRFVWGMVYCPYRNGNSYRKSENHKPKELTEREEKTRAWRQHKGIDRDKAKGRRRRGSGVRQFWVKKSARRHRRWAKRNLHRSNLDAFGQGEYKVFADPWLWD